MILAFEPFWMYTVTIRPDHIRLEARLIIADLPPRGIKAMTKAGEL
jgi:hypothetical protein